MKKLLIVLALILTSLGAACDQTPTSAPTAPKQKAAEAVVAREDALHAELLTLSSAIGALQGCRAKGIYTSPLGDVPFYKLATIMRKLQRDGADLKDFVTNAHRIYLASGVSQNFLTFTAKPGGRGEADSVTTHVQDADACKKVESKIKSSMEPGKILDVPEAAPIRNGGLGIGRQIEL